MKRSLIKIQLLLTLFFLIFNVNAKSVSNKALMTGEEIQKNLIQTEADDCV